MNYARTGMGVGRGLFFSAAVTGAVLGLLAFLLSGCSSFHPVRAVRLAVKARRLECRNDKGVPVPCPLRDGDDGL